MQREFTLDETKGPNRFQIMWIAMAFMPQQGMPRQAETLRRESYISRKLRNISLIKTVEANSETGIPEHKDRVLKSGEQKLTFEQPEIDLIRTRIEAYPFWNPVAEESPIDVYDWLNSGKEIDNASS